MNECDVVIRILEKKCGGGFYNDCFEVHSGRLCLRTMESCAGGDFFHYMGGIGWCEDREYNTAAGILLRQPRLVGIGVNSNLD